MDIKENIKTVDEFCLECFKSYEFFVEHLCDNYFEEYDDYAELVYRTLHNAIFHDIGCDALVFDGYKYRNFIWDISDIYMNKIPQFIRLVLKFKGRIDIEEDGCGYVEWSNGVKVMVSGSADK